MRLAKNPKTATPMPIYGQNSISRTEGLKGGGGGPRQIFLEDQI